MKNVFCIMLALLMTLSMVACGQAPDAPTETPVKTPESTVPPTVEDTDANETVTYESVSFDNLMDYETKIHELGFKEFKIDIVRPAYNSGPACVPSHLEFNETEFKLYFDYYVLNDETSELELVQGWTLYGRSGQTSATNFSDYKESDYECSDVYENTYMSSDFVRQVDYSMYNMKDNVPEFLVSCTALYYPGSNNAYNLVYKHEDALNITIVQPHLLAADEAEMETESMSAFDDSYRPAEPETDAATLLVMKIKRGDDIVEYYYEAGMTLTDWAKTDYNVDHWMIYNDGGCYSSDYEYYISPNNIAIEEIPTVDGVIHATPGQE